MLNSGDEASAVVIINDTVYCTEESSVKSVVEEMNSNHGVSVVEDRRKALKVAEVSFLACLFSVSLIRGYQESGGRRAGSLPHALLNIWLNILLLASNDASHLPSPTAIDIHILVLYTHTHSTPETYISRRSSIQTGPTMIYQILITIIHMSSSSSSIPACFPFALSFCI